jgi:short-subunit dehydrogenase
MNKVVLITGASSGIGKSAALELKKKGNNVYGAARRLERMKDLEQQGIKTISMDVIDENSVRSAVQQILDENGRIDILVNNAGYGMLGAAEEVPISDVQKQFDVNVFGLARVTKAIIPIMRKNGSGTIVNISSIGGKMYTPYGAYYHASKHAIEGYSDCLRIELKPFNIKVVIIEPGIVHSEFQDIALEALKNYSGEGPYSKPVKTYIKYMGKVYSEKFSTKPEVIGKLISKASLKRNPRTRYSKGRLSGLSLFSRKILTDKMFDWSLLKQVQIISKF